MRTAALTLIACVALVAYVAFSPFIEAEFDETAGDRITGGRSKLGQRP